MSICFQADGDLKFAIVKAVRRREPAIDFASAREAELEGVSDPEVLERAAGDERVLVSHDRRTILKYFRNHLAAGSPPQVYWLFPKARQLGSWWKRSSCSGRSQIPPSCVIRPIICPR